MTRLAFVHPPSSGLDDNLTFRITSAIFIIRVVHVVPVAAAAEVVLFFVLPERGSVMSDLVTAKIPLVLHGLAALLAAHLSSGAVHVQDVLENIKNPFKDQTQRINLHDICEKKLS